ncbi:MAG TPA: hypothetical protein VKQ72_03555 [Aggregatilineales bacterium]|nr:hypothetical protein [Aggregatilineales bacterium]
MKHFWCQTEILVLIGVAGALLSACAPTPPPLPTLAVLPSVTPTSTPTQTFTPTSTSTGVPTATSTETPSATETVTITPTLPPTLTQTPTMTATPTNTSTATPTEAPTSTLTPTVAPQIMSLTASPSPVQSGGQVVVAWSADATKLTLDEIDPNGSVLQSVGVGPSGTLSYTLNATNGNQINFRLTAEKANKTISQIVSVIVACSAPWLVSPAPGPGCPQPAQTGAFTYQAFEYGAAFYVPNTNQIFFLDGQSQIANVFTNTWNASIVQPTQTPPSGFFFPTGPIGYMWAHGYWSDGRPLQAVFGWGISDFQNYSGSMQIGPGGEVYLTSPIGGIYRVTIASGSVGIWAKVG